MAKTKKRQAARRYVVVNNGEQCIHSGMLFTLRGATDMAAIYPDNWKVYRISPLPRRRKAVRE